MTQVGGLKSKNDSFCFRNLRVLILLLVGFAFSTPAISQEKTEDVLDVIKTTVGEGNTILSYPLVGKARRGGNILLIDKSLNYEIGIVDPKDERFSSVYKTAKVSDLKYKLMAGLTHTKIAAKETRLHFGTEFTKLFIAGYYPIALELATAYHKGPLALKEQLDSLSHPIGYIGLASFMLANRMTSQVLIDMRTKEIPLSVQYKIQEIMKNDPRQLPAIFKDYRMDMDHKFKRKLVDFLPISQIGMATGMLAQHVVSDTYNILKECFFRPPQKQLNPQQALAQEQRHDMACDQALEEVNLENYSSGVTSLVLSSFISAGIMEGVDKTTSAAGSAAHKALLGNTSYSKVLFVGGALFSRLNAAGNIILGMKWTYQRLLKNMNGMGLFFIVDNIINAPIKDLFGNFLRANQETFDFETSILPKIDRLQDSFSVNKTSQNQTFNNDIEAFSKSMESWRNFKLRNFQYSHAAWVTKTENVRLFSTVSQDFYHDFLYDLYSQNKKAQYQENKEFLQHDAVFASLLSLSHTNLDKKFPFFGLNPLNIFNSKDQPQLRYLQPEILETRPLMDLYSSPRKQSDLLAWNPAWLERYQYNVLFDVSESLQDFALSLSPNSKAQKIILKYAKELSKENWSRSGPEKDKYDESVKGFIRFAQGLEKYSFSLGDSRADTLIKTLYNLIGRPQIIDNYGQGFSRIYLANSQKEMNFSTSQVKIWSGFQKHLRGNHITDYLIYSMACGPRSSSKAEDFVIAPTLFGYDLLYDSFNPPRIVGDNVKFDICLENQKPFEAKRHELPERLNRMYSSKIIVTNSSSTKTEYDGIYAAIVKNLNPDIFQMISAGNITDRKNIRYTNWERPFDTWWNPTAEKKLEIIRDNYKREYGKVVESLIKDLRSPNKWTESVAEDLVAHGVLPSIKQELRLYGYFLNHFSKPATLNNKALRTLFKDFSTDISQIKNPDIAAKISNQIEVSLVLMDNLLKKVRVLKKNEDQYQIQSDLKNEDLKDFDASIEAINAAINEQFKDDPTHKTTASLLGKKINDKLKQTRFLLLSLSLMDWEKMRIIENNLKDESVNLTQTSN